MSKHMISSKVICPYYQHENGQVIYCEGVQEGTVIHLAFSNRADAKAYKLKHCRKEYKSCIIMQMLDRCNE